MFDRRPVVCLLIGVEERCSRLDNVNVLVQMKWKTPFRSPGNGGSVVMHENGILGQQKTFSLLYRDYNMNPILRRGVCDLGDAVILQPVLNEFARLDQYST